MIVSAQSIEPRGQILNEDVVGAALTGDAPTRSEWSTILLPTKVSLIFSAANLALAGFPLTNALGESMPSRY